MDINELYQASRSEGTAAKERLFEHLSVRLHLIANLKIGNSQDAEEVVQDVLMFIAREYKDMEFKTSFRAWAYKVFDNRLLNYISAKKRQRDRGMESLTDYHNPTGTDCDPDLKAQLSDCLSKVRRANNRYARILNLQYQGYETEDRIEEIWNMISVGS